MDGSLGERDGVSTIATQWDRIMGGQPDPGLGLALVTGVAAAVAVLPWRIWRISRTVVTIAHEGGHALAAVLTGRRLKAVRLHSDTSGLTVSRGKPRGPGMVFTALAGYVAPSLLGLGSAVLLAGGRITLLLWLAILGLAAMLVMIRNVFGVLSVVLTGGLVFAVSWYADTDLQAAFAYLTAWFLLLGGVRPVFELHRKRRAGRAPASDADQLARLTGLSATLWVLLFGLVSVFALVVGAALLLPAVLSMV
ncbi:MAG: M50 family metallopeptidase [Kutzneria sp.]|nr:M50 family metallopeptidase [Kutzneria sp.]MBV9846072.1 M50 family metallopeptidase [Kutzneria sp.]